MLDKFQEQHVYITSLILVNIDDSVKMMTSFQLKTKYGNIIHPLIWCFTR